MDLELNKGDTFYIHFLGERNYIITDTIYYTHDGRKKIAFKDVGFTLSAEPFYFLEGSGPCNGLVNEYNDFTKAFNGILYCHFKDSIKAYDRGTKNCGLLNAIEENTNQFSNISLYPNPIRNYGILSFSNEEKTSTTFSIYDISGKCLYTCQTRESLISFSVENLKPGTYYYRLTYENGKQGSGSFIRK